MLNLIEQIQTLLTTTGYSVFFNEKNEETSYPYVIFKFLPSNVLELREDFPMEVDIWTKDVIECMEMTKIIDGKLNRFKFLDANIQFSIYKINQLNLLPDEDMKVKRNQLRYKVKTYFIN